MVSVEKIINTLKSKNINFFTGVPDSTLKLLIKKIDKTNGAKHYPAFNEGSAISLGIGYNLATSRMPCVYLQNSGLSNAINPLISIAHKKVYSIPMLLIIGWRGSPSQNPDEPQHNVKGKITPDILNLLNIKNRVLRTDKDLDKIKKLINYGIKNKQPVACLIERNILIDRSVSRVEQNKKINIRSDISRENVIINLLNEIKKNSKIISTTGYTSRELHQLRKIRKLKKGKDFYMVGGMGHSSMVALGLSLSTKNPIICLDGDGSLLMHLGSLRSAGLFGQKNYIHILLNNASHESVGGQSTFSQNFKFNDMAKIAGYKKVYSINKVSKLKLTLKKIIKSSGPSFLEIKIKPGAISNLKRPKDFIKIKKIFKSS